MAAGSAAAGSAAAGVSAAGAGSGTSIHDSVRSRVAGAYTTVNYGIQPLGSLLGGGLAGVIGLRATLLVAAVGGAMSVFWLSASLLLAATYSVIAGAPRHRR